jgi:hypothetical protein
MSESFLKRSFYGQFCKHSEGAEDQCVLLSVETEIKEKYGGLRLAATGGNSETDAIIDRCERDSQRICVKCGKPATRISKGWICPYCDDCIGDAASVVIE